MNTCSGILGNMLDRIAYEEAGVTAEGEGNRELQTLDDVGMTRLTCQNLPSSSEPKATVRGLQEAVASRKRQQFMREGERDPVFLFRHGAEVFWIMFRFTKEAVGGLTLAY